MLTLWGYVIMGMGASGGIGMSILWRSLGKVFFPGPRHEVHFSPQGSVTQTLVKLISKSRREILLQGFQFNSRPLAEALLAAKKKGVHLEVLLDSINEKDPTSEMGMLLDGGIPCQVDDNHGCMHSKVMIIDNRILVTGSFNFTRQSEEENVENLLVIQGVSDLVYTYREHFFSHKAHARAAQKPSLIRMGNPAMGVMPSPVAATTPTRATIPNPAPSPSLPSSPPAPTRATVPSPSAMPVSSPIAPTPPVSAPVQARPAPAPSPVVAPAPISSQPTQAVPMPQPALGGTPSVAASLANMGLGPASTAPVSPSPVMHPGHPLGTGPHPTGPVSGVSSLGGTQMTPEMLRAMVQNAANARDG